MTLISKLNELFKKALVMVMVIGVNMPHVYVYFLQNGYHEFSWSLSSTPHISRGILKAWSFQIHMSAHNFPPIYNIAI